MNNTKRTVIALAALLGLAVTAARPASSSACYMSPEDMIRMTAQNHFWKIAKKNDSVDARQQRVRVRDITIEGETATALAEVTIGHRATFHRLAFTGKRYSWKLVTAERASKDERFAMVMMSKLDALSLALHQARRSRALARR